jgi:hypothetical protein
LWSWFTFSWRGTGTDEYYAKNNIDVFHV